MFYYHSYHETYESGQHSYSGVGWNIGESAEKALKESAASYSTCPHGRPYEKIEDNANNDEGKEESENGADVFCEDFGWYFCLIGKNIIFCDLALCIDSAE